MLYSAIMQNPPLKFDLNYAVIGAGEPVLLIAGGFCDHHIWQEITPALSTHYQVIMFDNRGSGLSADAVSSYSVELLASDVLRLMDHLGLEKAHIVGHSMGGFVAQYFAAYYPERVQSLSLLSSILKMNAQGIEFLDQIIQESATNPDAVRQKTFELGGIRQTIPQILQQVKLCRDYDATAFIAKIEAPTLLMSGLQEPICSVEETKRLAASIRNVMGVDFLDCNHMLQKEKPAELIGKLLLHLRRHHDASLISFKY